MKRFIGLACVGWLGCRQGQDPDAIAKREAEVNARLAKEQAAQEKLEAAREPALAKAIDGVTFGTAPCTAEKPMPPAPLGSLGLTLGRPLPGKPGDETHGYLLMYLRLTGSTLEVIPHGSMPLERAGFGHPMASLIVDRLVDPVFQTSQVPSKFSAGTLEGRVVLWNGAEIVCGAKVAVHNTELTVVHTTDERDYSTTQEDPLSKARVDLINEAFRDGLSRLTAVGAAAPEAPAPKLECGSHRVVMKRMLVDLRGVTAAELQAARFTKIVGSAMKPGPARAVERIWLLESGTLGTLSTKQFTDVIETWTSYLLHDGVTMDEAVIVGDDGNPQVLASLLGSMGLTVSLAPATMCANGVERNVTDVAGPKRTGVRVIELPNP